MRELVDLYFHGLAMLAPPLVLPFIREGHRIARQSIGEPLRKPVKASVSATVLAFRR